MELARRDTGFSERAYGSRLTRAGRRIAARVGPIQLGRSTARRGRRGEVELLSVQRIELACPASAAPQLAALLLGAPLGRWPYDHERV